MSASTLDAASIAAAERYIQRRQQHIDRFWRRVGGRPPMTGKTVLELGCGYGELAIDMAHHGATILGVDINADIIAYGQGLLAKEAPEVRQAVTLRVADCRELPADQTYDLIISRDTLEHVQELEEVIADVARRLRPGGLFLVGFGPLYNSPYGGHWRMRMLIPWGHLMFPEPLVVWWANRFRPPGERVTSIKAMGLNQRSLADYERVLQGVGLSVQYWQVNHGERKLSRLFAWLSRCRPLRELFAHDVHAVLRKDG